MSEILFSGTPSPFGGLSNERELARQCPPEFKRRNPWSDAAMLLFFRGGKLNHWLWKSADPQIASKQLRCFKGLISTFDLKHEDKEAVAGWMLSEMLTSVPDHVAATPRGKA
jgi:hypothetical protein